MSRAKAQAASCVGYGRDGMLIACASPSLPVGRGGRCSRCDQLHRRGTLAKADQFPSINDVELPGEVKHATMLHEALGTPLVVAEPPPPAPPTPVTLFAMFDAPVAATANQEHTEVAVNPWHRLWPACLLCGRTKHPHATQGNCTGCAGQIYQKRKRGTGVTVLWLPFVAGDPARYDLAGAKLWAIVRDRDGALAYLERRASAGGIPTGGKVVIRQTKEADRLPERVIRPVAA